MLLDCDCCGRAALETLRCWDVVAVLVDDGAGAGGGAGVLAAEDEDEENMTPG